MTMVHEAMTPLSDRARALRPSATLAVTARVNALKRAGHDVIGFGAGQPDFDTPDSIKEAAMAALRAGWTKYVATAGDPDAREAIAEKLRAENKINCDASHIVITVGAKEAMFLTLQAVVDPGAEVLLPAPAWVSYAPMIELAGGRVIEMPTSIEGEFRITPDDLAEAITPRTAAIIINTPSNPTGMMYGEDELRALADVLAPHPQITVITDEIYEKIIFGERAHFSLGSIPQIAERVVTINGLSKAFAMTGWRIGYLCAPGHDGAVARAVPKIQDQVTGNITSFCYAAIVEALTKCGAFPERMREVFAGRAEIMYGLMSEMPETPCPRPEGAFYLFPDVRAHFGKTTPAGRSIDSALQFAEALLEEAGVALVPGEDFGECARTHVRVSFACSEDQIREGCRRIDAWLRSLR